MNLSDIKNIAVIGLGTMGPGLAQSFAQAGLQVYCFDTNSQAIETGQLVVQSNLDTAVEFGALSKGHADAILANIAYANSLPEALQNAQVMVEAVTENHQVKAAVYGRIAANAPPDSMLWSNTSALNIYELLPEALKTRAIIAHWFSPPHILPLVEVVKGPFTGTDITELTVSLLKKIKKTPVVLEKFVPGFAINRIQRIINREVFHLLDGGYISAEDLDMAVKASLAPRMMLLGLVQRMDFTGLDLSARNLSDERFFDPPVENRPPALHTKIKKGELGVKTGKGFFDYSDRELAQVLRDRDRYLLKIMQGVQFCLDKGRLF